MDNIGFSLLKIITDQFAVLPEYFKDSKQQINLAFGIDFSTIPEERIIAVKFSVKFTESKSPFLILSNSCFFQIEEKSWEEICNKEKATINITKGFALHLGVFIVGTTRGILHTKTEGTEFNDFTLPPVNLNKLITKDIELKLSKDLGEKEEQK